MIIRKLRLDKGLSQEQLADMAGVSTRTLQRIERGARASPETLKCLAAVLETEFSVLRKEQPMSSDNIPTLPELHPDEREAMEYVRDIRGFYSHAFIYGVIMVGLTILNLVTGPDRLWVVWPMLGWGIGLAAHGFSVFEVINLFGLFGDDWERRQIKRRLGRK